MGRRELLIIVAFLAVGGVVYQFTAPPPAEGRGFTLRRLVDEIRSDIRRDSADATYEMAETIALSRSIEEVRLSGVTGHIEVHGEDRRDVAYEFKVRSTGPEPALALEYAKQTRVVADDLGQALWLRVEYPEEGRQTSEIVVRMPRALAVRLEGNNSFVINDLRAVRLEGVIGDTTITGVAEVSGTHRNGRLSVAGAESVSLTTQASRATFDGVTGSLTLRARSGETRVTGATGRIEVEQTNNELQVIDHTGSLVVNGSGGRVDVERPRGEVRVDGRGIEVTITLDAPTPVSVITTNELVTLLLEGSPAIQLDARVTEGEIVAGDLMLSPTTDGTQTTLEHAFGASAAARVILRNRRDDIVIRLRK